MARRRTSSRSSRLTSRLRKLVPNRYLLPAVIYITALTIFPSIYAVYVSLLKWNLATTTVPTFIGFQNYISAITNPLYQRAMLLTFTFASATTGVELLLGVGVALLINR